VYPVLTWIDLPRLLSANSRARPPEPGNPAGQRPPSELGQIANCKEIAQERLLRRGEAGSLRHGLQRIPAWFAFALAPEKMPFQKTTDDVGKQRVKTFDLPAGRQVQPSKGGPVTIDHCAADKPEPKRQTAAQHSNPPPRKHHNQRAAQPPRQTSSAAGAAGHLFPRPVLCCAIPSSRGDTIYRNPYLLTSYCEK